MAKKRAVVKKSVKKKVGTSSYTNHHYHETNSLLLILAGGVVIILCLYLLGVMKVNQFGGHQFMSGNQMFDNNMHYQVNQESSMPSPVKDSLQRP